MNGFRTPILLIIFKRHHSLIAQIGILRGIRPQKLYVFADGPANAKDLASCKRARSIVKEIDWACDVRTKFMEANLGCGRGPATAISWFFENETEGIILEDDLLPHADFFRFCAEMLERYRDDRRIMDICGTNRMEEWGHGEQSYYFSQWGSSSGWAAWRRAWEHFDYDMRAWDDPAARAVIRDIYRGPIRLSYLWRIFNRTRRGGRTITWWDYQWSFAKNINSGLSIIPAKSLVRNVGCDRESSHDRDATHTFAMAAEPAGIDFPLRHPLYVYPDRDLDEAVLRQAISCRNYLSSMVPFSLKRRLKQIAG